MPGRRSVEHGSLSAAELEESVGLVSLGRLCHHLKALTGAGVVSQERRGNYHVSDEVGVEMAVMVSAASRIATS